MAARLLPVRHPNADFFIADIFAAIPVKADQHTMEHPFFALSTKKDIRSIEYARDGVTISLSPSAKYGLPTMMDKDILLYVGSLLMREINAGRTPPKTMRFSAHDLMATTNRDTSGDGYRLLNNAFERVTGCLITTSITTKDYTGSAGFHILERYEVIESSHDKKRMVRVEVTVSDWFYHALVGREVLTIHRDYFRLRKPLERRLYELARKHCGKQEEWTIGLENLREKCGALSPLNYFRFQMKAITKTDHLPDYQIALDDQDRVKFFNRYHVVKHALLGGTSPAPAAQGFIHLPSLSQETLRRGAALVEQSGTGWNYREILNQYDAQRQSGKFTPKNHNAAFIGFVKKKIRQRA